MRSGLLSHSPVAGPVHEVLHGIDVEDPFRWLEDQDSPETRAFIQAEQTIYREYLSRHKELRGRLVQRVTELLTVEIVDLPVSDRRGGLLYLKRNARDEQKAIYHQNKGHSERLLLSVEMLGRDIFTSLAIIEVSPNGRYLVFGIRKGGEDVQEISIFDLMEQRLLPDRLPRGFYRGLVFEEDGGFYYVHEEVIGRYQLRLAVRRHALGDDLGQDREIFYAGEGPAVRLILQKTEDNSGLGYLVVSLESVPQRRFLVHRFPLDEQPQEILRLSGATFAPRVWAGTIEASTTHEAPRGRIVRVSLDHCEPRAWTDIVPETIESVVSWEGWGKSRVVHYTAGCRKLTRIFSDSGELIRTIEFPASGTCTLGHVDECAHRLFYSYSDTTELPQIQAIDLDTGEHRLWWRQPTLLHRGAIEVESRTYASNDGSEIPITLLHPSRAEGIRPVFLSAYGGGGVSTTPKFSAMLTILIEAGFSCAIAHVRGGGEGGLEWHCAAQKQSKQTSVDDLLSAARWLIESGFTREQNLGIAGQSSGALLTLCAVTQGPHLFRAALALGPIADLTRFHLFGVARGFVAEFGSPDNPDEFRALYRLSPYHHVQQDMSPLSVLIISGDCDKRCDALHARKMIAQLKSVSPQSHPILLDYTETRGHKSVLPLAERIRALADRLTFLIAELGPMHKREQRS